MDTLVVLLLKVLLILISLTIYQNHSRNPFENEVLLNEAITNASSVYITNRYFQQVISISDGLHIREKIGIHILKMQEWYSPFFTYFIIYESLYILCIIDPNYFDQVDW